MEDISKAVKDLYDKNGVKIFLEEFESHLDMTKGGLGAEGYNSPEFKNNPNAVKEFFAKLKKDRQRMKRSVHEKKTVIVVAASFLLIPVFSANLTTNSAFVIVILHIKPLTT